MKHLERLLSACLLAALLAACGAPGAPSSGENGRPTSPAAGTSQDVAPATAAPTTAAPPASAQPRPAAPARGPELIASGAPRVKPPPSRAQTAALARGLNTFAFDLYRAGGKGDGNLIYSPYSIAMAFSMVYAGARGRTEAQIADVLGFLPQRSHHQAANALQRRLDSLAEARDGGGERVEGFQLRDANAVWGQQGFPFENAYLRTLAEQYGSGVRAVDFGADPEAARKAVNEWVADQTAGRIRNVLAPGVVDSSTRLILANAIYFKAAWYYPFQEGGTKDAPFMLLDGRRVTVPMMRQDMATVPYAMGAGYEAVVLPYAGATTDMVVIQPGAGRFKQIEAKLGADFLREVRAASRKGEATVSMPHFRFESELNLASILPGMGMPEPFGPGADFDGIARDQGLYISAAVHRATVATDEKGTEATAATVIVMPSSAPAQQPPHVTINRPFIFAIVERETGAILFLGRVTNPNP